MAANRRLLASVALGALISSAILSATSIYADAIRDLGLRYALEHPRATNDVDIRITREAATARQQAYRQSSAREDAAVREALAGAVGGVVRQGTSQTFYLTAPNAAVNEQDLRRPRAQLRFRDGLDTHLTVVRGELPFAAQPPEGPVAVALSEETATRNNVSVGDRLALHAWWDTDRRPMLVQIAALVRVTQPGNPYWTDATRVVEDAQESWEQFVLLLPEDAFFAALTAGAPTASATYADRYTIDARALNARDAPAVATGVTALPSVLAGFERRVTMESGLAKTLETFDDRLFFVRIPLFVLLLQIGGIVAYYLVMVATMLVERQAPEIAVLRSRGASPGQLLFEFGIEGFILALLAAAAGPLLAAAVISALGPMPAFTALSGGGPLEVHLSTQAYAFAIAGALLAFGAFMIPAWRATRSTVVEFRRASARPRPVPLLLRYYLDVALVVVLAILFWRLRQDDQLFTRTVFGGRQSDPLMLATPTVLMLTVGVVFLRLFPLALRLLAWMIGRVAGAAALVGMRALARDPSHYSRLVLMLMLATGVGMFGATFSATLARSYDDRARYPVGADVRAADMRALFERGDEAFLRAVTAVPARAVSPAIRTEGAVLANGKNESVTLLGVEPDTFREVAYFRDDFAAEPLTVIADNLARNAPPANTVALPDDMRQIGVWAKFPDIRGPVGVIAALRDGNGRLARITLGVARPADAATREWRFFNAPIEAARPPSGRGAPPSLTAPYTLEAVYFATQSAITAQRGVALLGPLHTSNIAAPPLAPNTESVASDAPFAGARLINAFPAAEFEVIQGQRAQRTTDTARSDPDAPTGASASVRYEWNDTRVTPRDRGLRPVTDGEAAAVYLPQAVASRAELRTGDTFQLLVSGVYLDARLAGTFELFPTYDPNVAGRSGFAVIHARRLAEAANGALATRPIAFNEAWFASDDPVRTREALVEWEPQTLRDTASERALADEDPLIAAGWAGILSISFGTVLLLSAIGFVLYSYLTAQKRALEFAILRTLGFSRRQVFLVVALEYCVIVIAGMGLGTIVGLQVGQRMMEVFGVSETGAAVLPPFALAISWGSVAVIWAVLGAAFIQTMGAVVLLYVRLAIHRALRVGEG